MTKPMAQQRQWAKIIARAWVDDDFKAQLLSDATSIMKEQGMDIPEGLIVNCVEATDSQAWLVIPPKPVSVLPEGDGRIDGVHTIPE